MCDFSVVIPIYNSEKLIEPLFFSIRNSFALINKSFEIIFVDDCSNDSSVEKIMLLNNTDIVKLERLNKNYGQYTATVYGVFKAKGNYVITLDADSTYISDALKSLISISENYCELGYGDIVYEKRRLLRTIGSKVFNLVIRNSIHSGSAITEHSGSSFRLIKRSFAINALVKLRYPIMLDIVLIDETKQKIQFTPFAIRQENNLSSYSIVKLLYLGFLLLMALLASKIFQASDLDINRFIRKHKL